MFVHRRRKDLPLTPASVTTHKPLKPRLAIEWPGAGTSRRGAWRTRPRTFPFIATSALRAQTEQPLAIRPKAMPATSASGDEQALAAALLPSP
ncbi:hypothetical protein GCM10009126_06300 [Rhodanobacter caeni]|uniref:Uncharacterized protein n=1 Tax=Rhodanobacter caeni TaxID=657654 RepID=A0ABP3DYN4_9GAMM